MSNLARIRNLGIVAHIDAGKTTVSERLLYVSGVEPRIGAVDEGTATMDFLPEERERGITIAAAATTLPWRDCELHLIDTPGHVDFTVEVERSLRVLDGAVLVVDAVAGVQAQSETVWRQLRRHRVPALAFVNKCDRAGADFLSALASLERRLGVKPLPLQFPFSIDGHFAGHVDLLRLRACDGSGASQTSDELWREIPIPAHVRDEVGVLRSELLDALADFDDGVLACVLEAREPPLELLRAALRRATLESSALVVLCGAALHNIGVEALLDAIVDYLPSPLDMPPTCGFDPRTRERVERASDPHAPLLALAFKQHSEAHGELHFVRIYAGKLQAGAQVWNPRTRTRERVGRLLRVHADAHTTLDEAGPGEIVAVTGLHHTSTGDTLCDEAAPLVLEALEVPEPVIAMVLEPRSTLDRDKLRAALARLAREDPTFHQREDEASGQWLLEGMGELHLEVALHRLQRECGIEAAMGRPRVTYRESPRPGALPGRGAGRIERLHGAHTVFGAVEVELGPSEGPGEGPVVVEWAPEAPIPAAFRSAIGEALLATSQSGPRLGYPMVGARVRVVGGESRPDEDSESAFVQAALQALRAAAEAADMVLLEPRMAFEVETPAEFSSGILADLNARHAEVEGVECAGKLRVIRGKVPLARMFGYSTAVRSLSQGRASFSMLPAGFCALTPAVRCERGLDPPP
ncbi:MAG: elongation factor G [Planctomycetes bacterium]|nr:elongation factor G [Planctomycetota bacterium]